MRFNEIIPKLIHSKKINREFSLVNDATIRKCSTERTTSDASFSITNIPNDDNTADVHAFALEKPSNDQVHRKATLIDKTDSTSRRVQTRGPTLISQVSETDSPAKPPDPSEQRVKSLNDQAKRLKQQAKQIKAQDAVKKAQAQVQKLSGRV